MNINELAKEVHETAVRLGEWERPPALPEALCLIQGEIASAFEEWRNNMPLIYGTCALAAEDCKYSGICDQVGRPGAKDGDGIGIEGPCEPEGIAVELADVILHTLDLMAALGVDVDAVVMAKHRWNKGRAGL